MKKVITSLLALVCLGVCLRAQNVMTTPAVGQSPLTFVRDNLAGGGVFVFNVKFQNTSSSIKTTNIGTFEANGASVMPFEKGIVLATGDIAVAEGPNLDGGSSNSSFGGSAYIDPEMTGVASGEVTSCASIDFDFVSLSSSVMFNYMFGSEEYPEYVCSSYNDCFAFFLTGPDPETGNEVTRNIAMIPGTDTIYGGLYPNGIAVTVNSVNNGQPGDYGNEGKNCFYEFSEYYIDNEDNYGGGIVYGVGYDGLTNKLSAEGDIVPCQVYHMHIAVCNVGDQSFDSGVFLEGNSFSSPNTNIGLSIPGVQQVMGSCPKGVKLTLGNTGFTSGTVFFEANGTAKLGVDYDIVDESGAVIGDNGFAIDKSERSFYVKVRQGVDLSVEKTFDLFLTTQLCAEFPQLNLHDTMHFRINKGTDVRLRDTVLNCTEACFEVTAPLEYGTGDISYRWVPADGIANPYERTSPALIFEDADYSLIATGGTGCSSDTASVKIRIKGSEFVGIDDVAAQADVRVTDGRLLVKAEGLLKVEVYAVDGRLAIVREFDGQTGLVAIDLAGLESGVYAVRVATSAGVAGAKMVINK